MYIADKAFSSFAFPLTLDLSHNRITGISSSAFYGLHIDKL